MRQLLRNLVIFSTEGDCICHYDFHKKYEFGPQYDLIQEYYTTLYLLAHQQQSALSIINFEDENLFFFSKPPYYFCLITDVRLSILNAKRILIKMNEEFRSLLGFIPPKFQGNSTFFEFFIKEIIKENEILAIFPDQTDFNLVNN